MRSSGVMLLALLLPVLPVHGAEDSLLVAVDRAALRADSPLRDGATVYHAFEDALILGVPAPHLAALQARGWVRTVLGRTGRDYWLMPGPDRSPGASVVYEAGDALILDARPDGARGVPLRPTPWTLAALRAAPSPAMRAATGDSLVAAIAALVDPDSVRWWIQSLQDFGTRYARAGTRDTVSGWIRAQFLRMGYTDVSFRRFTYAGLNQANVVATLPGANPQGELVVIGAHHDSYSSGDPMVFAPGADDNASGTAAVLEIARVLRAAGHQPELTIRFETFAAEEVGLVGSFVAAGQADSAGERIRLMINHDMIGHTLSAVGASSVDLNHYSGSAHYRDLAMQAVEDVSLLTPRIGTLNSGGSDSYSYWSRGFPAVYFEERDFTQHYHSPQDIIANLSVPFAAEVIRASCATALRVSMMPGEIRGLAVRDRGDGSSLSVSWSPVHDADLAGYRVTVTGDGTDTTIVTPDTTLVVGGLQAGVTVAVSVAAEDAGGTLGFAASATGMPGLLPLAPGGVAAIPGWHRVMLRWRQNQELDLSGYRVYRGEAPDGGAFLAARADTALVDSTAATGVYYYYRVSAVDSAGNEGVAAAAIRSRVVSLDQGVLLVDETADGSSPPVTAPDQLVDALYAGALLSYPVHLYDIQDEGGIGLADLGAYSTVVWYNDESGTPSATPAREDLQRYLEFGGRFLHAGYRPSRNFSGTSYASKDFGPGDFLHDYLSIRRMEHSVFSPGMNAARAAAPGFGDVRVDPSSPASQNGHLRNIEAIHAAPGAQQIYTFDSELDSSFMRGSPVGVVATTPYRTVVLSFPLAYMREEDSHALLRHVVGVLFGEPTAVAEERAGVPERFALEQNYPNPFNPSTTLRFELPREADVSVRVYDVLGREIALLYRGIAAPGRHETRWDAAGNASGVYFVRIDARAPGGGSLFTATRKVVLLQ